MSAKIPRKQRTVFGWEENHESPLIIKSKRAHQIETAAKESIAGTQGCSVEGWRSLAIHQQILVIRGVSWNIRVYKTTGKESQIICEMNLLREDSKYKDFQAASPIWTTLCETLSELSWLTRIDE